MKKFLEEKAAELLRLLNLQGVTVAVKKEEQYYCLHLQTDNPGLLIGQRGRTVAALQTIFSLAVMAHFGPEARVLVDVNDYRRQQEERLTNLAQQAAAHVRQTGRPAALMPMSAYERRLIHLALAAETDLETHSDGEGSQRHVVISPKKS